MTYIKPINFLRMYKVGEYIYGDMFIRRYEGQRVDTLLNKLTKQGNLEEYFYFKCPECYHKSRFFTKEELKDWNKEVNSCYYCGANLNRKMVRPGYKVLKKVAEDNEMTKGNKKHQNDSKQI